MTVRQLRLAALQPDFRYGFSVSFAAGAATKTSTASIPIADAIIEDMLGHA